MDGGTRKNWITHLEASVLEARHRSPGSLLSHVSLHQVLKVHRPDVKAVAGMQDWPTVFYGAVDAHLYA